MKVLNYRPLWQKVVNCEHCNTNLLTEEPDVEYDFYYPLFYAKCIVCSNKIKIEEIELPEDLITSLKTQYGK